MINSDMINSEIVDMDDISMNSYSYEDIDIDGMDDMDELQHSYHQMIDKQQTFDDDIDQVIDISYKRKVFENVSIVSGGTLFGALGFFAGPIVGLVTSLSGFVAGVSSVLINKKMAEF